MNDATKRSILRGIHIIFGLPILGYIYGPPEEVRQYAPVFQFLFVPVIVLSGFWMWKGHVLRRLISQKIGIVGGNDSHDKAFERTPL